MFEQVTLEYESALLDPSSRQSCIPQDFSEWVPVQANSTFLKPRLLISPFAVSPFCQDPELYHQTRLLQPSPT